MNVAVDIVAIDAGNSRIKWGVHDGTGWRARGVVATVDVADLADAVAGWPENARIVVCNVAGPAVAAAIAALLPATADVRHFSATASCCGVSNAYDAPAQLGADRWAALVGAHSENGGERHGPCLVVCAGTATTIDQLDADGSFRGGVIVPGFDLMRAALARNTAQLPLADGRLRQLPTNTMDAIVSGCLQAQLGAIERMFAAIADKPGARCVLTGGGAPRLLHDLDIPACLSENLILDGLVRYGASL